MQISCMQKLKYISWLVVVLLACNKKTGTWTVDNIPDPKSVPGWNYVSNPDHILTEATVDNINDYLKILETTTTDQGAVVVVNSIGNQVPKTFATSLLRKWGVGQKEKNNGFLMLLVIDQRRVEFEVGYGLEGTLTDVFSKRIQEQYMFPYAKEGDYNTAVLHGVLQICQLLQGGAAPGSAEENTLETNPGQDIVPPVPYAQPQQAEQDKQPFFKFENIFPYLILSFFFVIFFIITYFFTRKSRKKDFTKKYRTRSFNLKRFLLIDMPYMALFLVLSGKFSFLKLIIGFYGYLVLRATISVLFTKHWLKLEVAGKEREEVYHLSREALLRWPLALRYILPIPYTFYFKSLKAAMRRLRNEPVLSGDGNEMTKLGEKEDDQHLEKYQVTEEELHSVDYDVWYKAETGERKIFRYELFSKFTACPECKAVTYRLSADNVIYKATYESSGKGIRTYTCRYCKYEKKESYTIPRLEKSSGSSGSGSSGSSGGSSWGGGSSGGGGAGSSW